MYLKDFFKEHPKEAAAFSGGVDSAYLLYAAKKYGADVKAYYVKTPFQPQFELDDAKRLADKLGTEMSTIHDDILSSQIIAANPANRCYYCKKRIFSAIASHAADDGYTLILDGTNFSDSAGERPGIRALEELSVRSPLRECKLTKEDIRALSKEAGLFTWNKPAYACLATRIPCGEKITAQKLEIIEKSEDYLYSLGFSDLRVRLFGGCAKLQLPCSQIEKAVIMRDSIIDGLEPYFDDIVLDLSNVR